jgi:hypothetical protein
MKKFKKLFLLQFMVVNLITCMNKPGLSTANLAVVSLKNKNRDAAVILATQLSDKDLNSIALETALEQAAIDVGTFMHDVENKKKSGGGGLTEARVKELCSGVKIPTITSAKDAQDKLVTFFDKETGHDLLKAIGAEDKDIAAVKKAISDIKAKP